MNIRTKISTYVLGESDAMQGEESRLASIPCPADTSFSVGFCVGYPRIVIRLTWLAAGMGCALGWVVCLRVTRGYPRYSEGFDEASRCARTAN